MLTELRLIAYKIGKYRPQKHRVPFEASRGGAETMYPEYQKKLKAEK